MTDVTIRPLAAGDRAGWDALWKGYLAFYESAVPGEVTETTWARLIDPADDPYGYCAVDASGRLIGIVHYLFHRSTWTTSCYCYLEDLFVDPAVRGSGAGRALIEAVYAAAAEKGATRIYWNTQHFNSRARVLYDRVATLSPFIQYRYSPR
ncbi:MAG: GNAT family N-acetyltransferase [Rhodobiaceae bacterium]|nr:GNAT family N-acetyltransferase [Rhodobiaceae bacterium]MCC0013394.1 GNAT family N-acetyltransferase [Rhodobiaceae bacterium]MCC0018973.1 GNAT family N-acetyltransferase [Rhodobiaceae bacterium]MCC0061492.1 GNAT family N-acetyltransferase [Rhodobiaceae bacterium]